MQRRDLASRGGIQHVDPEVIPRDRQPAAVGTESGMDGVPDRRKHGIPGGGVQDFGGPVAVRLIAGKALLAAGSDPKALSVGRKLDAGDASAGIHGAEAADAGVGIPNVDLARAGGGDHAPSVRAERPGNHVRVVRQHPQEARAPQDRLPDADAVDRIFRRLVGHQRQRVGEPQQRAGVVLRILEAHAVGDPESDELFAMLFRQGGVCRGEAAFLVREGAVFPCQPAGLAGLGLLVEEARRRQHGHAGDEHAAPPQHAKPTLHRAHPGDGLAALEQGKVGVHFRGRRVALAHVGSTGAQEHLVELGQGGAVGQFRHAGGQFRELLAVVPGADLVEHLSRTVEVRLHGARPFRRQVAFGANERHGLFRPGDESDVGQFRNAVHEDDVRGLDVAVDQSMPVQVLERRGQREAQSDAFVDRQPAAEQQFAAQRTRAVTGLVADRIAAHVVGQLHHVVKVTRPTAHVQDVELALVPARHRLEALDPGELPLEGTIVVERAPADDLDGAMQTQRIPRQPDLAVRTAPDAPDQHVVGHHDRRRGFVAGRRPTRGRGGSPRRPERGLGIGMGHGLGRDGQKVRGTHAHGWSGTGVRDRVAPGFSPEPAGRSSSCTGTRSHGAGLSFTKKEKPPTPPAHPVAWSPPCAGYRPGPSEDAGGEGAAGRPSNWSSTLRARATIRWERRRAAASCRSTKSGP